ncbi:MAG: DUF4231 domain-containing protein [Nocardioidaceae bacterium]
MTAETQSATTVWDQQSVWSQTAVSLKARLVRWRTIALALTIAAAVLTTCASQVVEEGSEGARMLTLAAAFAIGLVPVIHTRAGRREVEAWTRARSVSEALKTELYSYQAGVTPYRGTAAEELLGSRTALVLDDARDLLPHTLGFTPQRRELPPVHDLESYVQMRLQPQIDWYRSRAQTLAEQLTWARRAELALCVVGVALTTAAVTGQASDTAIWLPVVTTVSAAVTAHVTSSRWEYQLVEYLRTASELERLRAGWQDATAHGDEATDRLVQTCEQVVSAQNDAWMAKWAAERA